MRPPSQTRPWRRLHIAGILAATAYAILAGASHLQPASLLWVLLACIGVAWICTLTMAGTARRVDEGMPFRWVLAYGLLFRAIGFLGQPIFEDDYFRFLWDGRMFARTGTPYGPAPADFLGNPDLDGRFEFILDHVNHPQIPTLYGPVLELVFLASYLISPGALWALKLLLVGAELGAFAASRRWLDPRATVMWLWCPLIVQETAFSAHPDALGLAAMAAALAAVRLGRATAAGVFLGLAAGARPFAVLLLPFLLAGGWRRTIAGFVGTVVVLHVPFLVNSNGPMAGLGAFAAGWEFNSAAFAVLKAAFGTTPAKVIGALVFATVYALILVRWRRTWPEHGLPPGDLVFGLLFFVSPVINPWYLQWLVPFVAIRPRAWSVSFLILVTLSYSTFQNLDPSSDQGFNHPDWVRPIEFGWVALAGLVPWLVGRREAGRGK